jgi:diguanylate cyclase (GGDEF)-like protein
MLIDILSRVDQQINSLQITEKARAAVDEYIRDMLRTEEQGGEYKKEILDLIRRDSLEMHFQPIVSAKDWTIFGYEALTRINALSSFDNVADLFKKAKEEDVISNLDIICRGKALCEAARLGMRENESYIFINVCPETVMSSSHKVGLTNKVAEECMLSKEKIILEFTEETAIDNYKLFKEAISYYKGQGYKIAIDDFGSGHGGLKMLSIIEPDFVKIDRHFISNIDKSMIKYNLVESMATACHRIGIRVIAEGVERQEELSVVLNMGIDLMQGFYLGKPSSMLVSNEDVGRVVSDIRPTGRDREGNGLHYVVIGDICRDVVPVSSALPFFRAVDRFIKEPELRGLPVVDGDRVVGMLHRTRFMEEQILGRCGYGMHLNTNKTIRDLMDQQFLLVEGNALLEEVAQRINARKLEFLYDDICVASHGKYLGTMAVSDLLNAMTERSIIAAKSSNPLTGLPGNTSIRREIEKRLAQNMHFSVCYIDIDNFKPFNDYYGFEKGDAVIKSLAGIISEAIKLYGAESDHFLGHIGGDDFIIIVRPRVAMSICKKIIGIFKGNLRAFHGEEDYAREFYVSQNRKGEDEKISLLSLSIGMVSTVARKIDSYPEIASIASEVKKLAKKQKGFSVVCDRRMNYPIKDITSCDDRNIE